MAVHRLCTLAITLAVLGSVGVGAISWRLSQGPVDLAWFSGRLEDAANANGGPTRLAIGSAALAWEGFTKGVDRPLDLRLTDVTVTDQSGRRRINIPRAEVSISLYELLFGRVVPRAVELDEPQLTLVRAKDGAISLDLGVADSGEQASTAAQTPLADLLAELARPAGSDRVRSANALLGQLHRYASMMRALRWSIGNSASRGGRHTRRSISPVGRKAVWTALACSVWHSVINRRS